MERGDNMGCLIIGVLGIAIMIVAGILLIKTEKSINNIDEILKEFEDGEDEDGI